MTDEDMMALREDVLLIAEVLGPRNIEACRHALKSIALGLLPESKIRELALCTLED